MSKRSIFLLTGLGILALGIGFAIGYQIQSRPEWITFEACANAGGEAWQVDIYHPDICPMCAAYQACEQAHNDYRDVCPECYAACPECQEAYSVYESCPECYGPCQNCQNEYRNDFESEEERYRLCPECELCDTCREDIETKKANCPACLSCNECKQENKKFSDIREVCPQIFACTECQNEFFPYPDKCPAGKENIGKISDAAIWFQCCK